MWLAIRSGEQTGRIIEVDKDRFVLGRDEGCDLLVPDEKVSRRHASILKRDDGRIYLEDLGSTNGTYVDGRRVTEPQELIGNEQIKVGDTLLLWTTTPPSGAATTIGVIPAGQGRPAAAPPPPPPPAPPRTGFTTERVILRRSVRRATIIGIVAAAIALLAVVVVIAVVALTGDDEPPPAADEASPEEIVAAARPATVSVDALVAGQVTSGGTGWVLDEDEGLIVTNAHVVNGGETFRVALEGDEPRDATVVAAAPCEDLALLDVEDTTGLEQLKLGSQSNLAQGETVVALGFPASASATNNLSATVGAVSVVRETFDLRSLDVPQYPNVIRTDTAINPGNSGGPLVDLEENLVGVNSAGITLLGGRTIQGESFAIGVDRVKEVTPILRTGDSIGWAGLGLQFPTQESEISSLGLPAQPGLIVSHVVPGTSAEDAGLGSEPALLVAINGTAVDNTLPSYCDAVEDIDSGETATFTFFRPGELNPTDVEVALE